MPFDIVTIGLLHTGEKGNPVVYTGRLQEAFPGCNGLSLRRDRWIPVTERLPETNGVVLAVTCGIVECAWYVGGSWHCVAMLNRYEPTHWMPLPEPPCCPDQTTPSGKTTPD